MKFLPECFDGKKIAPLHYIYHNADSNNPHDQIDIIFKDIETGQKYVQCIQDPLMEVYIVKKEYWDKVGFIRDYLPLSMCDTVLVHTKSKNREIGKILGIDPRMVQGDPRVLGSDLDAEHYYAFEFIREYQNGCSVKLSVGFLDIENDTMYCDHFPEPGEVPTNAITYIDGEKQDVYTFLLRNPSNPLIKEFEENLDSFMRELHDKFDDNYGDLKYHILIFDDELGMYYSLFDIIRECNNDLIYIWNLGYDMPMIAQRILNLGGDPRHVMCDTAEFKRAKVKIFKDNNPLAHKRRHICEIAMLPYFKDQLVEFAGVRSAGKKLPMKLSTIARMILKDEKYDYSEVATIRTLPYVNYRMFVIYNIKDVLLQLGIYRAIHDTQDVYQRCYTNGIPSTDAFTSTTLVSTALRLYLWKSCKYVMGNNRNKIRYPGIAYDEEPDIAASDDDSEFDVYRTAFEDCDDDEEDEALTEEMLDNVINEALHHGNGKQFDDIPPILERDAVFGREQKNPDNNESKSRVRRERVKGFIGAIVLNPKRMTSTGYYIGGDHSTRIHPYMVDFDTTSEYPVSMILMNLSNETLIGKIYLGKFLPDGRFRQCTEFKLPHYKYEYIDDDKEKYHVNMGAILAEMIGQNDLLHMGTIFLNLPSMMELLKMVKMSKIVKNYEENANDNIREAAVQTVR